MKLQCGLLLAVSALPVIAFSLGATFAQEAGKQESGPDDNDGRQAVVVTPAERNYMLNQMRLFVTSVQTISAGLGADDRAQASGAAAARGAKRNANDPAFPATLDAKLPPLWKQLGGEMRRGFDALAQGISAGDGTRKSLEQLGIVMTNCVACHATYRIAIVQD
jgi:hypothetical protein